MNARLLSCLCLLSIAAVTIDQPPPPPGFRFSLRSPKGKEFQDSLGQPMRRQAAPLASRLRAVLPPQPSITNIVVADGQVTLGWTDISSPFQIEGNPQLGGAWTAVGGPTIASGK